MNFYYMFIIQGDTMSISKDNTRTLITIPKELKQKLEAKAKEENRSFNNLIITVLKDYLKE
ncbi:DNA-binding protein [Clostridium tyrobutyricum]|uniref:DNA-binding protein n=2 Tax=Clostridium tyrobutyricum TaxID=1519 RepID=UPI0010C3741A|nr:DNA-binding protein [Clostridium tyrobutyricum]QCH27354.1 hypothetical protein EZN00_00949 [Clostridium tyrobutyricum]